MHLAELNLSVWKVSHTSQIARGFVDNVPRINALAERSEGFVWRKVDEERDASGANPVCPDDNTLMTLSVWETPEHLERFVWKTVHKRIYVGKAQWFEAMESHHLVMWWVDEGHEPSIAEAKERLDHLDAHGDTDHAFGWAHLTGVRLWQQQRCA